MKHLVTRISLPAITCLLISVCGAAGPKPRIELKTNDDDGTVQEGQVVLVTAKVVNRSDAEVRGTLSWVLHTVAFDPPDEQPIDIRIGPGQTRTFSCEVTFPVAGFVDVECELDFGSDKSLRKRTRLAREPERVRIPLTKETDFDEFWKKSLLDLESVPQAIEIEQREQLSGNGIDVFEVTMQSVDGVHVRGWLEVPADSEGPFPVVIRVPGYGANMKPVGKWDDMIVFSFNPRGHGNSQDEVPGKPVDYWIRGLDDKQQYFYRGAYLDCVRAVDYVASRSDVDTKRIAVWGGSQGGGFAFATASLDPRVDLCAADIPFLCDWVNYFKLTVWPEMNQWIDAEDERTWDTTLRTLSYFDTMNLVDRIRCPTFMGVGLQDQVCPPTTSFAAFNRISADKSYKIYPAKGHGLGREHHTSVWRWIRESFELSPSGGRK